MMNNKTAACLRYFLIILLLVFASVLMLNEAVMADDPLDEQESQISIDLGDAEVSFKHDVYAYTGKEREPSPVVRLGGKRLKKDRDYTLSYEDNLLPGTASVTVAGAGDYEGEIKASFMIRLKTPDLVSAESVSAGARIKWKAVKGADRYKIYRREKNSTKWKRIETVRGRLFYTDKSAENKTVYYYTVRAFHKNGEHSAASKPGLKVKVRGKKFTDSPLVDHIHLSPHHDRLRNHAIDTITIHCVVGQCSVETLGWVFDGAREVSSNYGIGYDGKIGMYVREKGRSWCSSNRDNDNRAVTIEVASDLEHPYRVNDAAYESLITLVTDICIRNGIDELKWKADPDLIGQIKKQNMTVHRWFSSKSCPGDYLFNLYSDIAKRVNENIKEMIGG